jgi:thioester reductase-like protein
MHRGRALGIGCAATPLSAGCVQSFEPWEPTRGSFAPTDRFRAAVQEAKIGVDNDNPHISAPVIVKYITDLRLFGLL